MGLNHAPATHAHAHLADAQRDLVRVRVLARGGSAPSEGYGKGRKVHGAEGARGRAACVRVCARVRARVHARMPAAVSAHEGAACLVAVLPAHQQHGPPPRPPAGCRGGPAGPGLRQRGAAAPRGRAVARRRGCAQSPRCWRWWRCCRCWWSCWCPQWPLRGGAEGRAVRGLGAAVYAAQCAHGPTLQLLRLQQGLGLVAAHLVCRALAHAGVIATELAEPMQPPTTAQRCVGPRGPACRPLGADLRRPRPRLPAAAAGRPVEPPPAECVAQVVVVVAGSPAGRGSVRVHARPLTWAARCVRVRALRPAQRCVPPVARQDFITAWHEVQAWGPKCAAAARLQRLQTPACTAALDPHPADAVYPIQVGGQHRGPGSTAGAWGTAPGQARIRRSARTPARPHTRTRCAGHGGARGRAARAQLRAAGARHPRARLRASPCQWAPARSCAARHARGCHWGGAA